MDDPAAHPALAVRSLADVAVANRLFGGCAAVGREFVRTVRAERLSGSTTLLDVGTGLGDIVGSLRRAGSRRGVAILAVGIDISESALRASRDRSLLAVQADAMALPFANASFDVVTCSQLLHHFADDTAGTLVKELNRVARVRVIVADIRRSLIAAAGIWIASFPLLFHPVSRRDGVISVLRGYTRRELQELVRGATGVTARVALRPGFRITASWAPQHHPSSGNAR
jgi:ubiquinone/menaquinone biosynthesis C-methylase UbiE